MVKVSSRKGKHRQDAGKIQTLSNQIALRGCQDARKDTGLEQQRWTEMTSTAKVDRSDVHSKGGPKRRQQQRWTEATSTAKDWWAEATSTAKVD
ncbi:hypothetical protein ElyMa_000987800 [Elysia marginata]|uniref:Uncharacterized protein n=1 Tax=Elysia marginata TaxID=1093978 RepID=A0AAV4HKA8_9GAST|nr:hypothetical protein ElyMa_000987800 [Elysia marginata]